MINLGWSEVTLGGVKNLVHGHSTSEQIKISAKAEDSLVHFTFLPQLRYGAASNIEFELNGSLLAKAEPFYDNPPRSENSWHVKIEPNHPVVNKVREFFKKRIMIDPDGDRYDPDSDPFDDDIDNLHYGPLDFGSFDRDYEVVDTDCSKWVLEQFDGIFEAFLTNGILRIIGQTDPFAAEAKLDCYLRESNELDSAGNTLKTPGCNPFCSYAFIELIKAAKHRGVQKKDIREVVESLAGDIWNKLKQAGLNSQPIYDTLKAHRHLDSVRDRPPGVISMATLPDLPKWEPWRDILRDSSLRKLVNETLKNLGIKHELVIRKRCTIVYQPEETSNGISEPHTSDFETIEPELAFYDRQSRVAVSQHDLGYGISTVVPVVSSILGSEKSLISIEQPELHVHPGLQTALGDAFILSAIERDNTLLIETHSEHLILRILRRIRETTERDFGDWPNSLKQACPNGIQPKDVAVLYVQPGENGSIVTHLRINELGEFIDEWPNGFFDERIREVF